jgi:hypothetical protein
LATRIVGSWKWLPGTIDADGNRTWKLKIQTAGDPQRDGPSTHAQTPGLPMPGATYQAYNDIDVYAWTHGDRTITPREEAGTIFFDHEYTWSTKAANKDGSPASRKDDKGSRKKCSDQTVQDPLLEPPSTSGSFLDEKQEETWDRNGDPLVYTSFEQIRGPAATFDRCREQVIVEQNVLNLDRKLLRSLTDKVNDASLWDFPKRCWKMGKPTWQRKSYGTCGFYYVQRLVFECNAEEVDPASTLGLALQDFLIEYNNKFYISHWDRNILDESSRVLNGTWDVTTNPPTWINPAGFPNANKWSSYINAFDINYQPCRVILSNNPAKKGQPAIDPLGLATGTPDANYIHKERYQEGNFLLLGIPTTL